MINDNGIIVFCLQICVMLIAAVLCRKVTDKLDLPSVTGELIGGIILGPTVLGALFPQYYNFLFLPGSIGTIGKDLVVKLGQLFFLFTVGLEINLVYLKYQKLNVISISAFGIIIPFLLGAGTVWLLPWIWGIQPCSKTILAMFIGVAVSISALPVIARILIDLGVLKTKLGTVILSSATIDDICGWILFSIVLRNFNSGHSASKNIWITMGSVIGFAILIAVVSYIVGHNRLTEIKIFLPKSSDFIGILAIVILLASVITEAIGIHAVIGAFLVGVVFSMKTDISSHTLDIINKFTNSFFVPLYFVSIGLKTNFITSFDFTLVLTVTMIACIGKIAGVFIGTQISRIPLRNALIIAFAMNARGAMEMILAYTAYECNIIDQRVFVALISMAIITTLISGFAIQNLMHGKAKGSKRTMPIYDNRVQES